MSDTILCHDKEDAKNLIDSIGPAHIDDWEFLPDGRVRFFLDCTIDELVTSKTKTKKESG